MRRSSLALAILAIICIATRAGAEASHAYLTPDLRVGDRLSSVFSKAVAITGPGFQDVVKRISGTGEEQVTAILGGEITMRAQSLYDGRPVQKGIHKRLADGVSDCWNGQCVVNDETSGTLFNRYLWGDAPQDIHAGSTWRLSIAKAWEIGPPGTERVRVLRLDPLNHEITLTRTGSGSGASSDDAYMHEMTITTGTGQKLDVQVIPGEAHWSGRTVVREGVIVADEILLERHVTLLAQTGQRLQGEERVYTLENQAPDQS